LLQDRIVFIDLFKGSLLVKKYIFISKTGRAGRALLGKITHSISNLYIRNLRKHRMKRHVLISGTGRTGTTFLVQLFTELGLDTGFNLKENQVDEISCAGLEWDLRHSNAPYIVKSPWISDYLDSFLCKGNVHIEHLIVPIRNLYDAAESRRDVMLRAGIVKDDVKEYPGGLWGTTEPEKQEQILLEQFYKLFWIAARYNIPVTLLDFPRIVQDSEYLRQKLITIFGGLQLEKKRFDDAFLLISKPELVHKF
jgi:hypothetical protein